ncbi:MAG: VapC toxin family PIN domain ribonuclease [Verrucomicrobia bacterium]|nr:VapC toxin family PIN domain ribonuclease [Verrucomicrobiota bacterium]
MVFLAEVNLLIALADKAHSHHAIARDWLSSWPRAGLATCPLTENGFLRIYGHPAYSGGPGSPGRAMLDLEAYRKRRGHRFLSCDFSFHDPAFHGLREVTPRQLTDLYLLALAARHGLRLATFDNTIPTELVRDGGGAIEVLG